MKRDFEEESDLHTTDVSSLQHLKDVQTVEG